MLYDITSDFTDRLAIVLSNDERIRKNVKTIALHPGQNNAYPYLLIDFLEDENLSKQGLVMHQLKINICVFSRDQSTKFLLQLASCIQEAINAKNCGADGYVVVSIDVGNLTIERSRDLVSSKLLLPYVIVIKSQK